MIPIEWNIELTCIIRYSWNFKHGKKNWKVLPINSFCQTELEMRIWVKLLPTPRTSLMAKKNPETHLQTGPPRRATNLRWRGPRSTTYNKILLFWYPKWFGSNVVSSLWVSYNFPHPSRVILNIKINILLRNKNMRIAIIHMMSSFVAIKTNNFRIEFSNW